MTQRDHDMLIWRIRTVAKDIDLLREEKRDRLNAGSAAEEAEKIVSDPQFNRAWGEQKLNRFREEWWRLRALPTPKTYDDYEVPPLESDPFEEW